MIFSDTIEKFFDSPVIKNLTGMEFSSIFKFIVPFIYSYVTTDSAPEPTTNQNAQAELAEEVGYLSPQERLFELEADPASSNSTFFDVSGGGGFVWFGLEILPGELVKCASGEHEFKFREVIQPQSMMGERITACRFFPWKTAATCGDMFSNAGVARLLINRLKLIKFL